MPRSWAWASESPGRRSRDVPVCQRNGFRTVDFESGHILTRIFQILRYRRRIGIRCPRLPHRTKSTEAFIELGDRAMQPMPPAWTILRQVCFLALLGVGVVFLSGPLLAVLSVVVTVGAVVLAFALVGFLVWTMFRTLVLGQQVAWNGAYGLGQHVGHFLRQTTVGLWK